MILYEPATAVTALAYLLIVVGLIGSVLPLVPGPVLIWLGVFLWAWQDGFRAIGLPTLVVLAIVVVSSWVLDLAVTATVSRTAGASWRSVAAALALGLVGGALGSGIAPVGGSLLGALAGAVIGIVVVEYLVQRRWATALRSSGAYLVGCALAKAAEVALAVTMVAIFVWQAFLVPP
jgi:uncharacterized protein YqgC (DUF456 family)